MVIGGTCQMGQENIQLWSSYAMGVSSASFKVSGGEINESPNYTAMCKVVQVVSGMLFYRP